jgi:Cu(I)/Ag(I) efflux system membrane protein CusA/SilA
VAYLHDGLDHRLNSGALLRHEIVKATVIEGAVHRLRPKLVTTFVVLASLILILWETGVGGRHHEAQCGFDCWRHDYSTVYVLILVSVFFAPLNERALRRGNFRPRESELTRGRCSHGP